MNPKEDIISILEDPFRRENLILKLKNLDENADIFQIYTNKIVEDLKLKKCPKGIFQKNILQNVFQFCDQFFCFSDLRLVCKSWKFVIETIRFSEFNDMYILSKLVKNYPNINYPSVFEKYFHSLQCVTIAIYENDGERIEDEKIFTSWPFIENFLLKNTHNLKVIEIPYETRNLFIDLRFFHLFLRKNENTISQLDLFLQENILPNDIKFPNLSFLKFFICEPNYFDDLQKIIEHGSYWERLDIMTLFLDEEIEEIPEKFSNFIISHHSEKCIYSKIYFPFDYFPIKIYSGFKIEELSKTKYGINVEYIFFLLGSVEEINNFNEQNWQNFQIEFQKMKMLKGVSIQTNEDWIYTEDEIYEGKSLFMEGFTKESVSYLQQFTLFLKLKLKVIILDENQDDFIDDLSKNSYRFEFE